MRFTDRLTLLFNRKLLKTAAGRAHVLNQLADAESSGEARIFDEALATVGRTDLARMIEKHREDELRHADLFNACLAKTGVNPGPVPQNLKLLERIDARLGGIMGRPIHDGRGVMEAYLLLQVVEERAINQFRVLEQAFREVDPATADVIASIGRDEERHLLYCHAIAKRFAPDQATHDETLARYRHVEAECFRDNGLANVKHLYANGVVGPRWHGLVWQVVIRVARAVGPLPIAAAESPAPEPALVAA